MLSTHSGPPPTSTNADLRWLDLLARQAADLIERRRLEDVRSKASDELDQRVKDRTKWLTLMHDVSQAIDEAPNWSEALHLVMRRICEAEDWQVGLRLCAGSRRARPAGRRRGLLRQTNASPPFHAASQQKRYARGQSLPGRVFEDGHHVWVNDQEALLKLLPVRAEVAAQSRAAVGRRLAGAGRKRDPGRGGAVFGSASPGERGIGASDARREHAGGPGD